MGSCESGDFMSTLSDKAILGNMEVLKHIQLVRHYLWMTIQELDRRAQEHDRSKLDHPETETFGEFTPQLENAEYLSEEYERLLKKVEPALEHHYAKNRHHPQHFPNGVNDMTLCDLQEMLCDWKAATQRVKNGNIRMSIEKNAKRFGLSPQLAQIMQNTVREMFQE